MINTKNIGPLAICVISFFLMQWHSIEYWTSKTGPIGWGWSIGIECAAIYFWLYRKTIAACLTSAVLLFGPLHSMAQPSIDLIQRQFNLNDEKTVLQESLGFRMGTHQTYQGNSRKRLGWSGRLDNTQAGIDATENTLLASIRDQKNIYIELASPAMQALALMLVLYAQISALRQIAPQLKTETGPDKKTENGKRPTENRTAAVRPSRKKAAKTKIPAGEIQRALLDRIDRNFTTASKWAIENGLTPKKASQIINHQKLEANGGDTASANTWLEFADLLGVKVPCETDTTQKNNPLTRTAKRD